MGIPSVSLAPSAQRFKQIWKEHHQVRQVWKSVFVQHSHQEVWGVIGQLRKQVGWFPVIQIPSQFQKFLDWSGKLFPWPLSRKSIIAVVNHLAVKETLAHEGCHFLQYFQKNEVFRQCTQEAYTKGYNPLMAGYHRCRKEFYHLEALRQGYFSVAKKILSALPGQVRQELRYVLLTEREAYGLVGQYMKQLGLTEETQWTAEVLFKDYRLFSQWTRQALREVLREAPRG